MPPKVTIGLPVYNGEPHLEEALRSILRQDFTDYMDASWRLLYDGLLIKGFLPAAQGLPERLGAGIRVADFGCGTGHAVNLMAKEYRRSDFVGYDIASDAIERARAEARAMALPNVQLEVRDVTGLRAARNGSLSERSSAAPGLRSAATALAPDGIYLMVEPRASSNLAENIGNPFAPWIYGMSVLHCMTVSLADGGAGLGTAWGEQTAREFLADAGFASVEAVDAPGPQNTIYICRR